MAPTVPQKVGTVEKNNRCRWRVGTISELLLQSPRTHRQHDTVNALTLQHVELMPDKWMVGYLNQ